MSEENKALTRRFFDEVVNGRNLDAIDEMLADDFVEHEALPGMPTDKEAPKQFFGMLHAAVPDLRVEIEDMMAEGDQVAVRALARGTHQGELMGIPGTGRSFEMPWVDWVEIRDGKCTAHWGVTDLSGLMQESPAPA